MLDLTCWLSATNLRVDPSEALTYWRVSWAQSIGWNAAGQPLGTGHFPWELHGILWFFWMGRLETFADQKVGRKLVKIINLAKSYTLSQQQLQITPENGGSKKENVSDISWYICSLIWNLRRRRCWASLAWAAISSEKWVKPYQKWWDNLENPWKPHIFKYFHVAMFICISQILAMKNRVFL